MKTLIPASIVAAMLSSLALAQDTQPAATRPSGPKIKLFATLNPGEKWAVTAIFYRSSISVSGEQPPSTHNDKNTPC